MKIDKFLSFYSVIDDPEHDDLPNPGKNELEKSFVGKNQSDIPADVDPL